MKILVSRKPCPSHFLIVQFESHAQKCTNKLQMTVNEIGGHNKYGKPTTAALDKSIRIEAFLGPTTEKYNNVKLGVI